MSDSQERQSHPFFHSSELFRRIVENAQGVVFCIDNDGIFVLSEGKALASLGLEPGQVVGTSALEMNAQFPPIIHGIEEALAGRVHKDIIDVRGIFFDIFYSPFNDENGNVLGCIGMAIDITEQRKSEIAIHESEIRLTNMLDNAPYGIFVTDGTGQYVDANPEACQMTGYMRQELLKMRVEDLRADPAEGTGTPPLFKRLREEGELTSEIELRRKDGTVIPVSMRAVSLSEDRFMAFCSDISEQRDLEAERRRLFEDMMFISQIGTSLMPLKDVEEVYELIGKTITRMAPDTMVIISELEKNPWNYTGRVEMRVRWISPVGGMKAGLMKAINVDPLDYVIDIPGEVYELAQGSEFTHMEDMGALISMAGNNEDKERTLNDLFEGKAISIHGLTESDRMMAVLNVIRDSGTSLPKEDLLHTFLLHCTMALDRLMAERDVRRSLLEKEVLLKEIHHRVKNNLQIVSSMLQLQSMGLVDEGARSVLDDSHNRIRSMALIHEVLYKSRDLNSIDMYEYINGLVSHLMNVYSHDKPVELMMNVEDTSLDLDTAIPCGIIINELITNSLKHGIPIEGGGSISVGFDQTEGTCRLVVSDDGPGLNEENIVSRPETLGRRLIDSLVEQIKGELTIETMNGTRVTVTFPSSNR